MQIDGLRRLVDIWRNIPAYLQEAIADFITLVYVLKETTPEQFAAEREIPFGSEAFSAAWESFLAERRVQLKNAYGPDNVLYNIYVHLPDGTPLVLGTIMWVYSTRMVAIGEAIGDPKSQLPTFRMLQFPAFPTDLGFDPMQTPESRVVEWGRIVLRRKHELDQYVAQGYLRQETADYLARHGSSELRARLFFCGRALTTQPAAIVANSPRRLIRSFNRLGMQYRPLYLQGVSPTRRILEGSPLVRNYFTWGPHLAPHVPARIMAQGVSAAIKFLATTRPEVLDDLPISLPHISIVNEEFERAMAALIATCGLQPLPYGLAALVRQREGADLAATR